MDAAPRFGAGTTFGRMFTDLGPFAAPGPALTEALLDLGRPGGVLDAGDDLSAGPLALITDPALRVDNPDNPTHTAGTTFMGQFFDHDVTFDVGSQLGVPTPPEHAANGRTPKLDLDSVYGAGPVASPHLYDPGDRAKFNYEYGGRFEDLPRGADMTAVIADPRNDEHVVLAGLHCAFMKFHNEAVDAVRRPGRRDPQDFAAARRLTMWHYQWIARPRVPAAVRGPTHGRRGAGRRPAVLPADRRGGGAGRVPGSRLPLRPQHGAPVVPGQHGRPRRPALRGFHLRRHRRTLRRPG